ncbi:MAG TPA: hypothetical protein VFS20_02940 [Longimicrobium sp.]|nr:hypothetical protein [Longimicrobium sp.]
MIRPDARRLFRAAPLVAGMAALVLAAACTPVNVRPRPPRSSMPPCKYNPVSCPDRNAPQPAPPAPDTTRPMP